MYPVLRRMLSACSKANGGGNSLSATRVTKSAPPTNTVNTTAVALLLFALSACVSPPTIRDSQSPAIGVSIMIIKSPVRLFRYRPDKVYFVTAERKEDLYTQGRLVESNYAKGDRAYLLNAPPGHYVAVAAYHKTESN